MKGIEMKKMNAYRAYIAVRDAEQRLAEFGIDVESVRMSESRGSDDDDRVADEIAEGKIPFFWQYPDVVVTVDQGYFTSQIPAEIPWSWEQGSEYVTMLQNLREEFIRKFMEANPNLNLYRSGGSACIFWKPLFDVGLKIEVGQALCERVLVREDYEEVIDPEALEAATKNLPKIKKVTPVYEWRCNDAELLPR